jgi:hypothetical protein
MGAVSNSTVKCISISTSGRGGSNDDAGGGGAGTAAAAFTLPFGTGWGGDFTGFLVADLGDDLFGELSPCNDFL